MDKNKSPDVKHNISKTKIDLKNLESQLPYSLKQTNKQKMPILTFVETCVLVVVKVVVRKTINLLLRSLSLFVIAITVLHPLTSVFVGHTEDFRNL